jgi:hypothetical protein
MLCIFLFSSQMEICCFYISFRHQLVSQNVIISVCMHVSNCFFVLGDTFITIIVLFLNFYICNLNSYNIIYCFFLVEFIF